MDFVMGQRVKDGVWFCYQLLEKSKTIIEDSKTSVHFEDVILLFSAADPTDYKFGGDWEVETSASLTLNSLHEYQAEDCSTGKEKGMNYLNGMDGLMKFRVAFCDEDLLWHLYLMTEDTITSFDKISAAFFYYKNVIDVGTVSSSQGIVVFEKSKTIDKPIEVTGPLYRSSEIDLGAKGISEAMLFAEGVLYGIILASKKDKNSDLKPRTRYILAKKRYPEEEDSDREYYCLYEKTKDTKVYKSDDYDECVLSNVHLIAAINNKNLVRQQDHSFLMWCSTLVTSSLQEFNADNSEDACLIAQGRIDNGKGNGEN